VLNEDDKLEEVSGRATAKKDEMTCVGGAVGPAYSLMRVLFRDLLDLYTPQKLKGRCLTVVPLAFSRRVRCSVFALEPYLTRAVRPQEYSISYQSMDDDEGRVDRVVVGRGQVVLSERSVFLRALEHSRRRSILSFSSSEAKESGGLGVGR
jgi:hypothetical protein